MSVLKEDIDSGFVRFFSGGYSTLWFKKCALNDCEYFFR